jgi:hypothetical protein
MFVKQNNDQLSGLLVPSIIGDDKQRWHKPHTHPVRSLTHVTQQHFVSDLKVSSPHT